MSVLLLPKICVLATNIFLFVTTTMMEKHTMALLILRWEIPNATIWMPNIIQQEILILTMNMTFMHIVILYLRNKSIRMEECTKILQIQLSGL